MEREFKQRYERQEVPSSLPLQSDILELSRALPQQTELQTSLFKRLLTRVGEYVSAANQPVFTGAFASILVVSGCVFLLKTSAVDEHVYQQNYSASVAANKTVLSTGEAFDSTNELSVSDLDWQEVMLIEDEFLLAGL